MLLGRGDRTYPAAMGVLPAPPPLWLRGESPAGPAVAVVGTRRADDAGRALAAHIARQVVAKGAAVVSGLAVGIDTAAHRAAVDAGGRTWAVVGCGADVASSAEDRPLVRDLLAAGGSVLAEVPPGTPVSPPRLVARDRLQTALSDAVVVVQTDLGSGTMHTARFAVAQGRPLAVIRPRDPAARMWRGNAALTDPAGCPPGLLHATGLLAAKIADRRPVADLVLSEDGDLADVWRLLGW